MKTHLLLIFLLTCLYGLNAQARKPAVEDFVGVIPKDYQATPKGTEVLFDFGNKVQAATKKQQKKPATPPATNWMGIIGVLTFLGLPFFMWFFMTRFGVKPDHTGGHDDKVKHLDDFREKNPEDEKKVS